MACFVVTTVAALGVEVTRQIVKHHEKKNELSVPSERFIDSKKLGALELMMWGGSLLLAGEHAFHGEITYQFPFLTAVSEGEDATIEMLQEMGTVGVGMLAILVVTWFIGLFILKFAKKKKQKEVSQGE